MTMNRHEAFEELISSSLTGEITDAERQWLDSHLDACSQCRSTLAAFADQRRVMGGLRHVAPPRDLGARVRTGIERGRFASVPFWRRPAVMFAGIGGSLAAVAGALLALVLMNGDPSGPQVGQGLSPTPSASLVEASDAPQQTLPPAQTATPDASPAESAPPSTSEPSATQNPVVEAPPEPDVIMAATGPVEDLSLAVVEGTTGEEVPVEAPVDGADEPQAPIGPPIVAELSPDGQWLAFITEMGQAARTDVWATRLTEAPEPADPDASPPIDSTASVGETVHLGTSLAGSPFLERLAWSSDGDYLAYTISDPDAGGEADEVKADVWIFGTAEAETRQLTDTGTAYAASFVPNAEGASVPRLWISTAGLEPASRLHELSEGTDPIDPERGAIAEAEGVFQPLLSPNGELAIFWRGTMATDRDRGWIFAEDGAPQLAEHDMADDTFAFDNERPLFSDLPTRGMLFESAAITWSLDGDAYAVWDTTWTGEQPADTGERYPDPARVYFGHATDPRGLTRIHAIDRGDVDGDLVVVDVEVAPTGGHLLITARQRPGGDLDVPRAELLLITRNVGDVADEVEVLEVAADGWAGPAVFQSESEPEFDSSQAP